MTGPARKRVSGGAGDDRVEEAAQGGNNTGRTSRRGRRCVLKLVVFCPYTDAEALFAVDVERRRDILCSCSFTLSRVVCSHFFIILFELACGLSGRGLKKGSVHGHSEVRICYFERDKGSGRGRGLSGVGATRELVEAKGSRFRICLSNRRSGT